MGGRNQAGHGYGFSPATNYNQLEIIPHGFDSNPQ
jgi:hypothetical protein